MLVLLVATLLDNPLFIDGRVEELFIPSPGTFCLQRNVADAILVMKNIFNLGINVLHLAEGEVLTVEVGREDDAVFVDHPGVDVVDVLDARHLFDVLGNGLVVQIRRFLHQDLDGLNDDWPGFIGDVEGHRDGQGWIKPRHIDEG